MVTRTSARQKEVKMKHFIIVKWNDAAKMKSQTEAIETLFKKTLVIPGIDAVEIHPSCSDRANRYDLMIEIRMDPDALPVYDDCEPHHLWKEQYGGEIAHKVIFDCE